MISLPTDYMVRKGYTIMYDQKDSEVRREKTYLTETLCAIENSLDEIEMRRKNIPNICNDSQVAMQLYKSLNSSEAQLRKVKATPYFARLDFRDDSTKNEEKVYIGKCTVFDEDNIKVVDWRSPIASLYYDFNLGRANYICPDGKIDGDILLKRQYTIKDSQLVSFSDVDSCSSDTLLQQCLSETSDARLKNIVATIQAEQNKIIRENFSKNMIVQGVAGSGKTTVALHRIAYLVYACRKFLKPEDILIIAPNRFFLNYISDILPDMGVEDINQKTYENFVMEFLNLDLKVKSSGDVLHDTINCKEDALRVAQYQNLCKFKSSLMFKEIIGTYLREFEEGIAEKFKDGFCVFGNCIVSMKKIMMVFERNNSLSIKERLTEVKKMLLSTIKEKIIEFETGIHNSIPYKVIEELRINGKKCISDFMKNFKIPNIVSLYKSLISCSTYYEGVLSKKEIDMMLKTFKEDYKHGKIAFEDLAPLLYLQFRVYGIDRSLLPKYLVIDEAQDFGEFIFSMFDTILPNIPMNFFGDIAQGIYMHHGISSWEVLNKEVFKDRFEVYNLTKSYRTTIEIMDEANKIASKMQNQLGIKLATPVLRHGRTVEYFNTRSHDDKVSTLINRIKEAKKMGYSNIALICKTDFEINEIYEILKSKFDDVHVITSDDSNYDDGINILPINLSKGLEFDVVIIIDASTENYRKEDILDGKLLYVAMTRAMHELDVLYSGELSKWL